MDTSTEHVRQVAAALLTESWADIDARIGREEFPQLAESIFALRMVNALGELTPAHVRVLFDTAEAALNECKVLRAVLNTERSWKASVLEHSHD
jgi:hypothetical protein